MVSDDTCIYETAYPSCHANRSHESGPKRGTLQNRILPSGLRQLTTKLKLFLAFLLPSAEPATISTVWAPEESFGGVKLKLPVLRRYWNAVTACPSRYTFISRLDNVVALSVTVA